jgi:hypothetical protein
MSTAARIGVVIAVGLAGGLAGATPPAMTAKEIMGKINKGPNAPIIALKRELQRDNPQWGEIQGQSKDYAGLVTELNQAKPPKGDAASWAKLTKEYAEAAKSLNDAAQKKDKRASLAAHGTLTKACTTCHKAHRNE